MRYQKPALTLEAQADLLISRGLRADRSELIERLACVSYYRLSSYFYPFRNPDDTLRDGTTFTEVWRRYTFDRRLRLSLLDAIERIEVSVRTAIIHEFAHRYGPFDYLNAHCLPGLNPDQHARLVSEIEADYGRSKEEFVEHFKRKYGDVHPVPPIWIVGEIIGFGEMTRFYEGVTRDIRRDIATRYGLDHRIFHSWLRHLNTVRNLCAHHARIWDRQVKSQPKLPRQQEWERPIKVGNDRIFATLTICKYMMGHVASTTGWADRLLSLLDGYADVPREMMGFPQNWKQCPIWKS